MLGGFSLPMELDDSGDDSDGLTEYPDDPQIEKFKAFSDTQLDDEITKYEGYVAGGQKDGLKLKDGGDKFRKTLQKLERVRSDRAKKRSPVGGSQKSFVIEPSEEFGSGGVGDWKRRCGTRPMSLPGLSTALGTCSTVKSDVLSTKFSPSGSALYEPFKSAPCNNGKSVLVSEIISQSPSPERIAACSPERETRSSSGEQAGPSSRELLTPNQFEASGSCSDCKKTSYILSSVRGRDGLFCSMCRRKALTPDPSFQVDSDLKTPAAKPIGGRSRKRKNEADIVGRTPDTAMEIDSSDEDEKPLACNGFVQKSPTADLPRRMGLRGNLRRRMEGIFEWVKIAYPSRTDPDAVEILPTDVKRLDPLEFLNDTVIDFYIKYIQRDEFLSLEGKQRFHFFNSFFYKKLSEVVSSQKKKGGADFSKLRKWTKGTNIFEKEYLFVPIHDKLHWSLAIICFPGCDKGNCSERCIIHLDSMTHGHDCQRVFRLLRSYLVAEWKHSVDAGDHEGDECPHTVQNLKNDDIPCRKVPVPLQDNESDCGLFLLHYIQKFVEHAPKTMKPSDLDGNWEGLGVFGREWFHSSEASSLRTSIQEQLIRMFEQEQLEHQESMFGQSNNEDKPDCSTTGLCEVVIPLDGEAS
ncbi:hypothetical protein KC19_7G047300 [Ceratodon purpureus]|uniref:Ubiquitin-like protease family profile domain-containing protein n=1 Tax=Ceratodon purpureus TaxID=3225 RepID=A0A8T0H624_CERPU|nr:hypothetical protein KC19_7G047300 [Ceratodon purpureus]